ncbi:DUF4260 domain-containing protein [Hymenobacter sp. GOD-10R]|uniref:DUF4260 domain-containing protein n=1 Tax=Hymenobacter sp. GOD-10R TaxID=3093922 RepID=UPI002D76CECF|nr:DUF4260 domain-containing protein [Hymenobacter sp. GOD-10R]WRQ26889.1 DUF4260 domain-containing protein [Hymenobacter sp. GOD-10R]
MKTLLKTEELAEALFALVVFAHLPYAWWVLPAVFLLPDLSMIGYLAGPRVGAFCYNFAHHKALAMVVGVAGWWLGLPVLMLAGTVLLFHSAFDRSLGYGLKYTTGFQDTHLGRVGKNQPAAAAN